jgi:hypothetical protein
LYDASTDFSSVTQMLIRLYMQLIITDLQIPPCFNLYLVMNKCESVPIVTLPHFCLHMTFPTKDVGMFGYMYRRNLT